MQLGCQRIFFNLEIRGRISRAETLEAASRSVQVGASDIHLGGLLWVEIEVNSPCMPELSRFFGIIIRMYAEPFAPHHQPHFHAYFQGAAAVYDLKAFNVLAGGLPTRQQRLVQPWAADPREVSAAVDGWEETQKSIS